METEDGRQYKMMITVAAFFFFFFKRCYSLLYCWYLSPNYPSCKVILLILIPPLSCKIFAFLLVKAVKTTNITFQILNCKCSYCKCSYCNSRGSKCSMLPRMKREIRIMMLFFTRKMLASECSSPRRFDYTRWWFICHCLSNSSL